MPVYQSDPGRPPDEAFEPGHLRHLVPGNTGRLLDARRTPVTVVAVRPQIGFFDLRLDAFEDAGAIWEVPLEEVGRYQFAHGSALAGDAEEEALRTAIARFDRTLSIPARPEARRETDARLESARLRAAEWLGERSTFLAAGAGLPDPAKRLGDERLWCDLEAWMAEHDLAALEGAVAAAFVSNPYSGDRITAHRVVIAELGLAPYEGRSPRDPEAFTGAWTRERRADHVIERLAFVRALFDRLRLARVTVHRGMSTRGSAGPRRPETFISTTFDAAVAQSHYEAWGLESTGQLARQAVPVERLFMTYLETRAMNLRYREAEAVLLHDPGDGLF